jgi:hypothetical protein
MRQHEPSSNRPWPHFSLLRRPWPGISRDGLPVNHPSRTTDGTDSERRRARAPRDGLHCLTCGRVLVMDVHGGEGMVCPDHGHLLAEIPPFRSFGRNETVWIVAPAGRRCRFVDRLRDGKRYRVALGDLRLLTMDDWKWNQNGSEHHERG